jgi:4-hydroxymandelate oxidase
MPGDEATAPATAALRLARQSLEGAVRLEDLEAIARQRMRAMDFDYVAGGAWDERTLAANRAAFSRWVIRPRVMVDVSQIDTATDVLGQRLAFPILLSPTGFHGLEHADGEVETARGAASAGAVFCVSTAATAPLEDVAAVGGPRWFQLYVHRDRRVAEDLVRRAFEADFSALIVTVDVPYLGVRERDDRNAFDLPPGMGMRTLAQSVATVTGRSIDNQVADLDFDPSLSWQDLAWLRSIWPRPILVKGILTAEDAKLAVEHGVDGIVVSNHGGRQLDGSIASLDALPDVVDGAGGSAVVLLDGGVRRGTDVLTALALGASAVMIGRPYLWGLAVAGGRGVRWVLERLRDELTLTMALAGVTTIAGIGPGLVVPAPPSGSG